jgi:Asp-tRNA(Asn)/Glu-tRNA(Gln) amidotransferase A subunit family amidase
VTYGFQDAFAEIMPRQMPDYFKIRAQPDAVERAAELDTLRRRARPRGDPLYCIPFTFKDPYDTKDMRSTGGADAAYDIDFPARDHTLVAQLRDKGAIIYAKAVLTEYNGRAGDPGGKNEPNEVLVSTLGYQRSTWGGNPCNPYDTTRAASLGSSSGSGVSVSTNLVMRSLCEETQASCRGPANHNSVALILPHKALISFLAVRSARTCTPTVRHSLPDGRRRCARARCPARSARRLLRLARHLHDGGSVQRARST